MSRRTLFFLVIAFLICGCGKNAHVKRYSCAPVLPSIGDSAIFDLKVLKSTARPGDGNASNYRTIPLRIKCVDVDEKKCKMAVYYLSKHKADKPAYFVTIDYATNKVDKRTTVESVAGSVIPRPQIVDGVPVPFCDFLVFDDKYIKSSEPQIQCMHNNWRAVISRRFDPMSEYWCTDGSIGPVGPKIGYSLTEYWKAGEWIWYESISSDGWELYRRNVTGVKKR